MVMFPSLKCVVFHRHGTFSVVCCLCTMPSDSKRLSSQIFSTLIEGGGSGRVELTGLGAHVLKCTKLWALHPTLDMVAQTWDSQTEVGGSEVQGHLRLQSKVRDVRVYSVSKIN